MRVSPVRSWHRRPFLGVGWACSPRPLRRGRRRAPSLAWRLAQDEDELKELEDEYEDDRFLEEYRMRRIAELKEQGKKPMYGRLELIVRDEWVLKVTDDSEDVWVVVFLFKDGSQ